MGDLFLGSFGDVLRAYPNISFSKITSETHEPNATTERLSSFSPVCASSLSSPHVTAPTTSATLPHPSTVHLSVASGAPLLVPANEVHGLPIIGIARELLLLLASSTSSPSLSLCAPPAKPSPNAHPPSTCIASRQDPSYPCFWASHGSCSSLRFTIGNAINNEREGSWKATKVPNIWVGFFLASSISVFFNNQVNASLLK